MPNTVLSILQIFAWLTLIVVLLLYNTIMKYCNYYPHLTDEESETWSCEVICQPMNRILACLLSMPSIRWEMFPHLPPCKHGPVTQQCWGHVKGAKPWAARKAEYYTDMTHQRAKPEESEVSQAAPPFLSPCRAA